MMRLPLIAILAMLALAPLAAAEETTGTNSTEPRDEGEQAWVDDCPPDMMCAASHDEQPADEGEKVEGNASGELPADSGSNCMDGQQEGEDCRDDVYYMTPPADEEPQDGPTYTGDCGGEVCAYGVPPASGQDAKAADETNSVPAGGVFLVALGALVATVLVARRRS